MLVHLQSNEMYSLNATGARAWELLSEGQDQETIAATLSDEYGIDRGEAQRELDTLLDDFERHHLVERCVTAQAAEASVAETRYLPWLARFRRTGRGEAELQLERADGELRTPAPAPRPPPG